MLGRMLRLLDQVGGARLGGGQEPSGIVVGVQDRRLDDACTGAG